MKELLEQTTKIIKRQNELKKLRGENFNIFSILKMESKENATHSAFLGELLNPKGSHLMGNLFLQHFINIALPKPLGIEKNNSKPVFDVTKANLKLEKYVGERNDDNRTGGRIDIYLFDDNGHSISIENKIYADDQNVQIERYVNHNKNKNRVVYLDLWGNEPSEKSMGDLKVDKDFYSISYKKEIIDWLELCLKESADQPILRESIKQYSILIKKLTNQLTDKTMAKEVEDLIKSNYLSAKTIQNNVTTVELNGAKLFLDDVALELTSKLGNEWIIWVNDDLTQAWSGLGLRHKNWDGAKICLEGQSKIPWSNNVYGVWANEKNWNRTDINDKLKGVEILKDNFKNNNNWPFYKRLLNLSTDSRRARLFNDTQRQELLNIVTEKLVTLALACEAPLSEVKKIQK